MARRPWLAYLVVGLLALSVDMAIALLWKVPAPRCNDEFSYLLAADTFAHGRLTNPTHPLWVHFESTHIIQQPTYASKYQPGQGIFLAVGQAVAGHPLVGVWLSTVAACLALYWMLKGWLPQRWAMLGGLLTPLYPVIILWGQSYWGGSVAVIGGALVTGAMRRLARRLLARDAVAMAFGMAVLANSRPFEGLVVTLLSLAALALWWVRSWPGGTTIPQLLRRVALPMGLVLCLTAIAMGYYNWRVTGSALRMPYSVHEQTYGRTPLFLWDTPRPEPVYRHKSMHDIQNGGVYKVYVEQRTLAGFVQFARLKLMSLFMAFYPLAMIQLPLLMLPSVLRDWWMRAAMGICVGLTAAMLTVTWLHPHYAAPMTGLAFLLEIQSMRHLRLWRFRGRPVGRLVFHTSLALWLACPFLVCGFLKSLEIQERWGRNFSQREGMIKQLRDEGGGHVIVVRYGPTHDPHGEWIYNEADIDRAPVIWAREMDPEQNRKLLDYFRDRKIWLLEPDEEAMRLVPYPGRAALDQADSSHPGRSF